LSGNSSNGLVNPFETLFEQSLDDLRLRERADADQTGTAR
jgi:hypothetical protein